MPKGLDCCFWVKASGVGPRWVHASEKLLYKIFAPLHGGSDWQGLLSLFSSFLLVESALFILLRSAKWVFFPEMSLKYLPETQSRETTSSSRVIRQVRLHLTMMLVPWGHIKWGSTLIFSEGSVDVREWRGHSEAHRHVHTHTHAHPHTHTHTQFWKSMHLTQQCIIQTKDFHFLFYTSLHWLICFKSRVLTTPKITEIQPLQSVQIVLYTTELFFYYWSLFIVNSICTYYN